MHRKKYDEKYQEEKGIGEEVEDPTGDSEDDEFNQDQERQPRLTEAYKGVQKRDEEA